MKTLIIVFVVGMSLTCSECFAQFGGNTGGGNTGGRQLSSGNTGGGATGGFGAAGQGNQSGVNTGQQLGTQTLNAADGTLSAQVGQNQFIGQGNNGFIGNRFAGQTNTGTGAQFGNLGQTQNERPQNQINTQRKQIRPQLRIAFDAPLLAPALVSANLSERVIRVPAFVKDSNNVNLSVDDQGMLTLAGHVSSDNERRLLEAYVRMEPGVRNVTNQLTVSE